MESYGVTFEDYPVVAAGEYIGTLVDIKSMDTKYGASFLFTFELQGDGVQGIKVSGMTQKILNPSNKLHRWLIGLGASPQKGEVIDPRSLVGRQGRLYVQTQTKDGTTRNRVMEINPLTRTVPAVVSPPSVRPASVPVATQSVPVPLAGAPAAKNITF